MQGSIDFSGVLSGSVTGEGGGGAVPVVTANATVDANTGTPSCDVVRTGTDLNPNFTFNFKNIKGATGANGQNGQNGQNGEDGVSPGVSISDITNGHRVTITDATHPSGQVFDVMNGTNGTDGTNGTNGADGVSPYVTITNITDGHRVNITDATHPQGQSFDVMNGEKGDTGDTGPQGIPGEGVPIGGTTGQILYKSSSADYHTEWGNIPSYSASTITYDPTGRAYISDTDVQGALDEVDGALGTINSSLTNLVNSKLEFITFTVSGCTLTANQVGQFASTTTFPPKTGYARRWLFISSNNASVVNTRVIVASGDNKTTFYFANLTNSSQTFEITGIGVYINNNDIHNAT